MTTADRKSLEALVTGALAELLGLQQAQIDPDERFSHYGLNSLSAATLITRLSALLGRSLPPTLVWDYPSPGRLAAFLSGESSDVRLKAMSPMAEDEPVAIVGLACRLPGAADPEAFWQMLLGGVEAVGEMPRNRFDIDALFDPDASVPGRMSTRRGGFLEQVDMFDAGFFGMSPREAVEVDPQQRLILELAWEALERAGIAPSRLHGSRTGVFMGAMWSDYGLVAGGINEIAQHSATGRDTGVIANRVSYLLGLTGPSMTVNTACSSSLVAVHLACRSLRSGESTMAFAGGVNLILTPDSTVAMTKFGAMAPDGRSKAFDARANGYVRGEGAGLVLLKPLSRALADGDTILALVRGSAVNNDGPSNGLTAPSPDAQRAVLRDACDDANIAPGLIDYVEAHGTGTMLGDPIEAGSLGAVIGQARDAARPLLLGSVKTNIGHLEAAAGITGMIKAVLALGHRAIPPSLHFESPNPHIDFAGLNLQVVTARRAWPATGHSPCAGVSSFGFGGTNAHVVLQAWQQEQALPEPAEPAPAVAASRPLVFVYSGNGAQWAGMGRELFGAEPVFRSAIQACDAAFSRLDAGFSLVDEILGSTGEKRVADTVRAQVLMFSVQVGLTRMLQLRGFVPDAVAGHSLGEIAAAHAAGALSLNDAAHIVLARSRLQAQAAGSGAMAVMDMPWAEAELLLSGHAPLVIAGSNTPDSVIVAGPADELVALMDRLADQGVPAQRIRVDVAYHSPAMDPLCGPLAAALESLVARPAAIPFYSTVDAALRPGESLDAAYWVQNLRQAVRFADTVAVMPDGVFVEISPHPILSRSIQACLASNGRAGPVAAVLSREEAAGRTLDRLLANLSAEGRKAQPVEEGRGHQLLTLSARDADALQELAGRYARALPEELADACFTASTGRDVFAYRLAVVAADAGSMRSLLAGYAGSRKAQGVICAEVQGGRKPDIALHFGAAAPRLGGLDRLLANCTPFADSLHGFYPVFHARFGVSWAAWLAQSFAPDAALQRAHSVAVAYAFARMLQAWGVSFARVTGDGPGALAAELLAGRLAPEQAILDAAQGAFGLGSVPVQPAGLVIVFGDAGVVAAGSQVLALQDGDASHAVLDVVGRLFVAGAALDWQAFYLGQPRNRVLLPSYAFQRRRHWPKNAVSPALSGAAVYALEWQLPASPPVLPLPSVLVQGLSSAPANEGLPAALDQLAAAYAAVSIASTDSLAVVADPVFRKRQLAGLQRLAACWQGVDAATLSSQLSQKYPAAGIEQALIDKVGRHLAVVLDGSMSPIDLLFPEGSMDQLQALYERSAFALTLAGWMRSAFAAATAGAKALRVLEIGAGTGGTTAHLLPLLPPGGEYLFTDVSRAFLERATARFGMEPGFSTALLDIEAAQAGQDVSRRHDVVVAVNVLHATRDLHATLTAVRAQLRPGGLLLLGEITGAPGWLDLVFGLLEGWWRFEDAGLRAESALLTPPQWRELLAETGFDEVAISEDGDRQGLIIARAGPVPGRRLVLGSGSQALRVRDALAARGMAAELHSAAPSGGIWLETIVCDREQTAAQACDELVPLFADVRFGRISLVQSGPASPASLLPGDVDSMALLDQAARQAARHAFALSSGAANPPRWGGTLQIEKGVLDSLPELLPDFLLQGLPEDQARATASGLEVARVKGLPLPAAGGLPVHPERSYLVTGGFGSLGFAFARWLAGRGARHIALVGRRAPDAALQLSISEMRNTGVQVLEFFADVSDQAAMAGVFAGLDEQAPPLAGVVHAAGQAAQDVGTALAAKLEGARVLHLLTRGRPLDLFLLFSSAAGTWGAAGKQAYAAANAALDAFAAWRRNLGLPALAIAWGRFSVRGLLSARDDAALAEMGMRAMLPEQAFELAWRLGTGPRACAVIADVDWARFREVCEARAERPLLRALPKAGAAQAGKPAVADKTPAPVASPAAARPLPSQDKLLDAVRQAVAEVLGHEDASVLSSTEGLFDLGLDSLLAVRLRSTLEASFGLAVPTAILFSHPTISALADWLAASLLPGKAAAPVPPPAQVHGSAGADTAIAVIGIGCRFPGGVRDLESFERLLFDGGNAITEVPAERWNWRDWKPDASSDAESASNRWGGFLGEVDRFDAAFFGITPKEAAFMDPQQRLLLETAWQAVEHAGIAPTSLAGRDVGVFVGITGSDYAALARRNRESGLEAQAIVGQPSNASAGRISFTLGLTGPALAVDTACSSSLVAIHLACRALRAGDCSSALAGGVNLMLAPETSVILAHAGMLSPRGQCRAFDAGADGFVRAEGCGMVLLKPLQAALADGDTVLAVVRGSATNHDGRASGFTVPNGSAQQAVLRAALQDARLAPAAVAYVEAHGTGTALGDPIEAHAMGAVFGGRGGHTGGPLLVGSVKSQIGHAESAAGVAGFIKAVLALQRARIPPTLHFERLNPHISAAEDLLVPSVALPFPVLDGRRIAGVSAFGASGTNAHVLLEAAAAALQVSSTQAEIQPSSGPQLLALSARHADSLRELAAAVGEELGRHKLADLAFSAALGRSSLAVRGFVLLDSKGQDLEQGRAALARMPVASAAEKPRLAFLFTGQGSQYAGMAQALYKSEEAFRTVWDRCDVIARPLLGDSLTRLVFEPDSAELLDQTRLAQPALFALSCALAALWRQHGVEPDVVLGHSVGEFAAAVSAGILTLEDGMALVAERGRLMQALPAGGGMLAVGSGLDALHPFMAAEPELSLAAENGPSETVLSGPLAALDRLVARLRVLGIRAQQLATSHAFHSSLMEPMLAPLRLAAARAGHAPARISFVSNLDGAVRSSLDADYWAQHAREPVRFAQGLRRAQQLGCTVFVEIGPHAVLTALAGRVLDKALLIPSMRRGTDERRTLLEALGLAWQAGVAVQLPALLHGGQRVVLPATPFRRVRHWLDWAVVSPLANAANTATTAGDCSDCLYQLGWQPRPLAKAAPAGAWLFTGAESEASALAGACRIAGMNATSHDGVPAAAWAGVLWFAPLLQNAQDVAAACTAFEQFVRHAPAPVWLVTRGAQAAVAGSAVDYRAAALWGLGRALAMQDLPLFAGMVDLPGSTLVADMAHDAESLAAFLSAPGEDEQVTLRGGQVLLPRLERLSAALPALPALRADRSYLVSGGFGGLGQALVRHLVAGGARSIAIVGRNIPLELPAEFMQPGVDIRSFALDVASAGAMKLAAAQIEAGMPPVAGIFHVAGIKSHDFGQSLHAKLGGAEVLHELSLAWPLEQFVLFSSAASVWGDRSLAAYAAANACLDGFAHWRQQQGLPALTVNWGRFDVRGMLDEEGAALFERIGLLPIAVDAAFRAMRQLAASGLAQATVASVNWSQFAPIHRSRRARPLLDLLAPPVLPAPPARPATVPAQVLLPQKAGAASHSRAALEQSLLGMLSEILGMEDVASIDAARGFFALGVDSFGIVDLRRRIEQELGIMLAPSALFDAPNVLALAAALAPEAAPEAGNTPALPGPHGEGGFDPIAIVGTACRMPGGVFDLDGLERLLLDGVDAIGPAPDARLAGWQVVPEAFRRGGFVDGMDLFDADFFGISPREAVQMDPQHRLLLELAWQALENAGFSPPALRGSRTGVFVGITGTEYADMARSSGQADAHAVGGQFLNAAAGRLSHALGLNGPSLAVDTACSSSAMALHLACKALLAGECDTALAGGANLLLAPSTSQMLVQAKMLSPHGRCATFDAAADGYVRAEACALVVLKRLSQAQADGDRVLATIRGTASNHDGASSGFTVPNGQAQQAVIRAALAAARVTASDVSYVEAHGTGTSLGDPIEMHALDAVFGEGRSKPLLVGSIKTNIGHAEAAAGVAGLLKLVVALRRSHIPAHLHFESINPHIGVSPERVAVAAQATHWEAIAGRRIAGLSAFGASGTNVHLVLQEAPALAASFDAPAHAVLALSARRAEDLAVLAGQMMSAPDPLRAWPEATRVRSSLPYRLSAVGKDAAEIREQLRAGLAAPARRAGKPRIAFLFTGQGAQYAGMAHGLYQSQPVFRAAIDRCAAAMRGHLPVSLTELLFDKTRPLVATEFVQPALFAVGYGLAQLWLAWGVQPVAMLGHSVGEITAACVAGVLELDAAARLVTERGRLMGALPPGGAMAAVMAPAASLAGALAAGGGAVVVAAHNGPANTVLSGQADALDRVLAELAKDGIRIHRLAVSHAFHSPLLEPMLERFEQFTAGLAMGPARIPVVSNRDGAVRQQFDAAYWRAQAREPVAFAAGMATLQSLGCDTFVEIGPQPVLCGMGRDCIEGGQWIASLRQGADDGRCMLDAAAGLWQAGASLDWRAVLPPASAPGLALPPYPFRRTRHWLDAGQGRPAVGSRLFANWTESPAFNGRMHSQTLGLASISGLQDSGGLVHVGLHLAFVDSANRADHAGGGVMLSGMQFFRPLVLAQPQEMQMLMNADGSASLHARQPDRSWVCHMQARVEGLAVAETARLDVEAVRSRCTQEVQGPVFYADLEQKGFNLGPGLRRITQLWRQGGEVLAHVSAEIRAGDEDALAFGLPAALFENCAQLPAAAFPEQPHAYMLLGWDRMQRSAAAGTDEAWIHARVTLADGGLTLHAQIGLYAAGGEMLVHIEGAVFRRTQQAVRADSLPRAPWAGQLAWVESPLRQPSLRAPLGQLRWALLAGDEKAKSLAGALQAAHPHIFAADGTNLLVLAGAKPDNETAMLAEVVNALQKLRSPAQVLLVTQGSWMPAQVAGRIAEAGAGIWGLAQVIRAERPDLLCRCIDLPESALFDEALLAELGYDGPEINAAWSGSRRFVARLAALPELPPADSTVHAARQLVVEQAGSLDGLSWQAISVARPEELKTGEVMLQVVAAAPGLRDTLLVYGSLADGALGSDCSGTVLATGPGVAGFRPGDAVMAYAPHNTCALGSHVLVPASLVRRKPARLGFAAAATLPVPFMTAWHGLVQVGTIKAGETVLVHSAGSAVGLAAIAVARLVGAHIVVTASLPKHAALRSMGLEVIGDSRSTVFAQSMAGRIDLAFGAFDEACRAAMHGQMAPGGRVVDLTRVGHDGGIDLDRLLAEQPEQFAALFDTVCAHVESGQLQPLPHEVLPADEALDALRRLSLGSVVGRLCLAFGQPKQPNQSDMRGTWLLTGANGGLGRVLAPHLAERGVTSMVLVDRSPLDAELLASLRAGGIRVMEAVLDIADEAAMKDLFARAQEALPPISAIVHAAGVVADAALAELDQGHFARTFAPKVEGARLLDRLSRHLPIRVFALFSSVVSQLPSARQGAYAAANAALEQVARRRRAEGLQASAISWGPWSLGIGDALGQRAQAAWGAWGVKPLSTAAGLALFDRLCSADSDSVVLDVDWARYCSQAGAVPPLLEQLVPPAKADVADVPAAQAVQAANQAPVSLAGLAHLPDSELDVQLEQRVVAATARVLRAADAAAIDVDRPFSEQGMDSLMATEFAEELGRQLGRRLPGTLIYNHPTPAAVTVHLLARIRGERVAQPLAAPATAAAVPEASPPPVAVPAPQPQASPDDYQRRLQASLSRMNKLLGGRQ